MTERLLEFDATIGRNVKEEETDLLCLSDFYNPLKKHTYNVVTFWNLFLSPESGIQVGEGGEATFLVEISETGEGRRILYSKRVEEAMEDAVEVRASQFRVRILLKKRGVEKEQIVSVKLGVAVKDKRPPGGYDHVKNLRNPPGSLSRGEERKIA